MQRNKLYREMNIQPDVNDAKSMEKADYELGQFRDDSANARKKAYLSGRNLHQKTTLILAGNVIDLTNLNHTQVITSVDISVVKSSNIPTLGNESRPNPNEVDDNFAKPKDGENDDDLLPIADLIIEGQNETTYFGNINLFGKVKVNGKVVLYNDGSMKISSNDEVLTSSNANPKDNRNLVTATIKGKEYTGAEIFIDTSGSIHVTKGISSPSVSRSISLFKHLEPTVVSDDVIDELEKMIGQDKSCNCRYTKNGPK